MNIGLGFAMIAVVIFLLLGNIVASLVTILCVISTVVELVGYMYFWDMTVDSIMVIFVVISLGFSVVTITGMAVAVEAVKTAFTSGINSLPADMLNLFLLAGGGIGCGAILGAITTRILIWNIKNSTKILGTNPG